MNSAVAPALRAATDAGGAGAPEAVAAFLRALDRTALQAVINASREPWNVALADAVEAHTWQDQTTSRPA